MTATTIRPWAAAAIASAITLAGFVPATVQAGTMATDSHDFIHRRMARTTPEARSVGQITAGCCGENGGLIRGSGVLVGGRYVLTAAHLVDDIVGGQFEINGQTYNINRFVVANRFYNRADDDDPNPDSRRYGGGADLALIQLDRRVVGARNLKATLNKSRREGGKTATIVGFGTGGNGATGIATPILADHDDLDPAGPAWLFQPVKRAGKNVIEPNTPFNSSGKSKRELRIDFDPDPSRLGDLQDAGLNPPSFNPFTGEFNIDKNDVPITGEFMPSIGDSGGGLFINGRLAGITSWTTRENSEFFSTANFTRLSVGWGNWVRDNIKAFNHAQRNGFTARPWNKVDNGGNGFRGVAKIMAESELTNDDGDIILFEGQVFNIFGPFLFFDENGDHFDVTAGDLNARFISDDLFANPGPLSEVTGLPYAVPEPASLALLGLGGIAMLRRTRR